MPVTDLPLPSKRFEYKYIVSNSLYINLKRHLRLFCRPDPFTLISKTKKYFIRSLYYDTCDFQAYEEKVTGVRSRTKLRLRSYWAKRERAEFIKVELKTREGNLMGKYVQKIDLTSYDNYFLMGKWGRQVGPVEEEFQRMVLLKNLRPKLLVDYFREAFVPLDSSQVRINFDHNLRFSEVATLFPVNIKFRSQYPKNIIFEIKTQGQYPLWLENIVRSHELTSVPNSKYAHGIEHTQKGIYFNS